jgi:hypothetical protein
LNFLTKMVNGHLFFWDFYNENFAWPYIYDSADGILLLIFCGILTASMVICAVYLFKTSRRKPAQNDKVVRAEDYKM